MTRILLALLLVGCASEYTAQDSRSKCAEVKCPRKMVATSELHRRPYCLCVPGALPKEK